MEALEGWFRLILFFYERNGLRDSTGREFAGREAKELGPMVLPWSITMDFMSHFAPPRSIDLDRANIRTFDAIWWPNIPIWSNATQYLAVNQHNNEHFGKSRHLQPLQLRCFGTEYVVRCSKWILSHKLFGPHPLALRGSSLSCWLHHHFPIVFPCFHYLPSHCIPSNSPLYIFLWYNPWSHHFYGWAQFNRTNSK